MNQVQPLAALQGPQLSGLKKADPVALSDALAQLLTIMNSRFNFREDKKLNKMQIGFLVGSILTTHWQFKFDEVVYVLREGIAGRLHTFDHIDEAVVLNWFREYEVKQREDLLTQHTHALRQAVTPPAPIDAMGPMYVKQYCVKLQPDQLHAYRDQMASQYPTRPELAEAVDDYVASLWSEVERAAIRRREQAERGMRMVEAMKAWPGKVPGEYEFEILPRLERLKDSEHTGAEEAA